MEIKITQKKDGFHITRQDGGSGEASIVENKYELVYFVIEMVFKYLTEEPMKEGG